MKLRLLLIAALACLALSQTGCGLAAAQIHRAGNVLKAPVRALSTSNANPLSGGSSIGTPG